MCPHSKEFLWDEQRKKWAQQLWSVSMWSGTWCCNGTTQLCHWKKQACLPSDNCLHHSFAELFPFEMWIYCLKNICLTSNQYVIHSATALPCHDSERRAKKRARWKDTAQNFIVLYPGQPFIFERFWFIGILWPFVQAKLTLWDAWWHCRVEQKRKPVHAAAGLCLQRGKTNSSAVIAPFSLQKWLSLFSLVLSEGSSA